MTIMLSRRSLIQASLSAAGGLMIAAFAPEFAGATTIAGEPWSPETGKPSDEVNAFVVIDPDNSITLRVAKSEMGQGVLTSLAMIVAEELECDFAKVKVEYASANRNLTDNNVYQSMGTGGSSSVRRSRVFLQQAGASARARLIAAAAAKWGVEPAACVASGGFVRHEASGRSATFGELAADAARVALAAEPAIKTPDQFRLIGEGLRRIDTPLKVTGAARFGIDTRLPGMAYAAAANCPVFGGKLKSYDFSAISSRRGVIAADAGDQWRCGRRRQFLARQGSAERDADRMGLRPGRFDRQRRVRRRISRRARWPARRRRRPWRHRRGLRQAGESGRGGLRGSLSRACADGAAQRDRALAARPHRRLDGHAGARIRARARGQGGRGRSEGGLRPQLLPRRRVRPPRGQRRTDPGGRGLQGPEAPDQADLDPRRGHPLGSLPPAGGAEDARRPARRRLARPASTSAPPSARSPARSAGARPRTGSSPRRSRASPTVPIAPTR